MNARPTSSPALRGPCRFFSLAASVLAACTSTTPDASDAAVSGPEDHRTTTPGETATSEAGSARQTDAEAADVSPALEGHLKACADFGGAQPSSVAETIDRLNALPEPVTPACFVASLPRPLRIVATHSITSAQPSDGPNSPRIFLLQDRLVLSVVPGGEPGQLLEFAEYVSLQRSRKGELAFPLSRPLAHDAPYARVDDGSGNTVCGFCHQHEERDPAGGRAFISDAMRPRPPSEVSVAALRELRRACDEPSGEGEHCEMLRALFDAGEVQQGQFDIGIATGF
jgi:hypothetical protein